jgi:UDP-N-acetyl-D-glucosamine dehydrogenase
MTANAIGDHTPLWRRGSAPFGQAFVPLARHAVGRFERAHPPIVQEARGPAAAGSHCAHEVRNEQGGFAMTPEFLLETVLRDEPEETALLTYDEALGELASGAPRMARQAGPDQLVAAVVGLGHAGLPNAVALHREGLRVAAIDTSSSRLGDIRGGRGELHGVAREQLRGCVEDRDFALTDRIDAVGVADLVLICVPTSMDAQRRPSLEPLRRACASVVGHARAGQTLVLCSAAPVGSTRELLIEPLSQRGLTAGVDVFVAFSPDRANVGVPDHRQMPVPRVVGSETETCFRRVAELLERLNEPLHRVSSPEAAEMVKLYESTFRAVNIALAFEMADACRVHQLDPAEVTEAAATKPFGFMAHHPSAGVGGPGVGVEPHHLLAPLHERGCPATLAEAAVSTIAARPRRIARRAYELVLRSGLSLRDARVLVVGAAYKPGVADSADSPAVEIISWLAAEGVQVDFHDPLVPALRIDGELLQGVDPDPRRDPSGFGPEDYELVVLTHVQPGHDYGWLRRCPQVLDCTYREQAGRRRYLP